MPVLSPAGLTAPGPAAAAPPAVAMTKLENTSARSDQQLLTEAKAEGTAGRTAFLKRAQELDREALRLRRLASTVHARSVEAQLVCDFIGGAPDNDGAARAALLTRFRDACSPGFDPDQHLERIGCANQTTMLARESLAIGAAVGEAMARAATGRGRIRIHSRPLTTAATREFRVSGAWAEPKVERFGGADVANGLGQGSANGFAGGPLRSSVGE